MGVITFMQNGSIPEHYCGISFHLWNSTNKGFGFNKILIVTKQMKYLNQKNVNNAFKYASVLIAAVRALHHQIIGGLVLLLVGPRRLRHLHVRHHPHPYIRCDSTLQRVSTQSNWNSTRTTLSILLIEIDIFNLFTVTRTPWMQLQVSFT